MQCIDFFSISLQRFVRKGINAKNPAIFLRFFLCQKNPVECNAWIARQKIVTEYGIAFLEIRLFLESCLLEFQEIWHENTIGKK